jgi:hypothetical protein
VQPKTREEKYCFGKETGGKIILYLNSDVIAYTNQNQWPYILIKNNS